MARVAVRRMLKLDARTSSKLGICCLKLSKQSFMWARLNGNSKLKSFVSNGSDYKAVFQCVGTPSTFCLVKKSLIVTLVSLCVGALQTTPYGLNKNITQVLILRDRAHVTTVMSAASSAQHYTCETLSGKITFRNTLQKTGYYGCRYIGSNCAKNW